MGAEIRRIQTTDSRTSISFYLVQDNTAGVSTAVDLTGLTSGAVKFEMFNRADGVETIAATATGVTFVADTTGLAHYQFATPMAIAAGEYYGYFVLTVSGKTDHFPNKAGQLRIIIDSHTQSGEEAYAAAVAA